VLAGFVFLDSFVYYYETIKRNCLNLVGEVFLLLYVVVRVEFNTGLILLEENKKSESPPRIKCVTLK
jgi:hypothetical protein